MDLVKRVLVNLHKSLKESEENGKRRLVFSRLDPFDFVTAKKDPASSPKSVRSQSIVLLAETDTGIVIPEVRKSV